MDDKCIWKYKKGMMTGTHFAIATCCDKMKYLVKIEKSAPTVGCADAYNWQLCPECGKPIEMDYEALGEQHLIL